MEGMGSKGGCDVRSVFSDVEEVSFHILPEIQTGSVTDIRSANEWFSRSLFFRQNGAIDLGAVIGRLHEMGMINMVSGPIGITKMGAISSEMYFHPSDVFSWKENFDALFGMGMEHETAAIAWAIGNIRRGGIHGDFAERRGIVNEFKSSLPIGFDIRPGSVIRCVLWWCIMGGPSPGKMKTQMVDLRRDAGRIVAAIERIDREVAGWGRSGFFKDLRVMISKRVGTHLIDLCSLDGIGKAKAQYLFDMGIKDAAGIAEHLHEIGDEVGESFMGALKDIADRTGSGRKM
jgi:hypothetical protein